MYIEKVTRWNADARRVIKYDIMLNNYYAYGCYVKIYRKNYFHECCSFFFRVFELKKNNFRSPFNLNFFTSPIKSYFFSFLFTTQYHSSSWSVRNVNRRIPCDFVFSVSILSKIWRRPVVISGILMKFAVRNSPVTSRARTIIFAQSEVERAMENSWSNENGRNRKIQWSYFGWRSFFLLRRNLRIEM